MMQSPTKAQSGCTIIALLASVYFLVNCYYYFNWYRLPSKSPCRLSLISNNTREEFDAKLKREQFVLLLHKLQPSPNNIFFVETSCAFKFKDAGGLILNTKQACAIYSAAYKNPTKMVTLVYTCPLLNNFYENQLNGNCNYTELMVRPNIIPSSDAVRTLLDLPNFYVNQMNLTEFYSNSVLSQFLNGILSQSSYPVEHNADLLRILMVYNFGGTYMDLDVISLHPLDNLKYNYIGAQEQTQLGTGVLNFDAKSPYLKEILAQSFAAYQPEAWAAVGPVLATRVLRQFCNLTEDSDLRYIGYLRSCNINVYGTPVFYPIHYTDWHLYYADDAWDFVERKLQETYVVHIWNHMSGNTKVYVGSGQPYAMLAEKHCAPVYWASGNSF